MVGQMGISTAVYNNGAGGGTFVSTDVYGPVIIAGGGAGAYNSITYTAAHGDIGSSGKNSSGG